MCIKFSLSSFTTLYLSLKKEVQVFSQILDVSATESYSKLTTILENMDKVLKVDINFEKEHKFQNKLRSTLTDGVVKLYSDKEQCLFNSCLQSLIRDFSNYILVKIRKLSRTKLSWSEMAAILNRMVQAYFDFSTPNTSTSRENDIMDVGQEQQDAMKNVLSGLALSLRNGWIKLSTTASELLDFANLENELDKDAKVQFSTTFGLSKQNLSLFSLRNYCLALSHFNLFSSDPILVKNTDVSKLFEQLPALDALNCFKMSLLLKEGLNSFAIKSYLLSKMLTWPQPLPQKKRQKNDLFEGGKNRESDGVAGLLTPYMCQNAVEVLYQDAARRIHVNVTSLDLMQRTLWSNIKVPLGEVADKLEQLDSFLNLLWANASVLNQVSCCETVISLPPQLVNWLVGLLQTFEALLNTCYKSDEKFLLIANSEFISSSCQFCQFLTSYSIDATSKTPFVDAISKLHCTLLSLSNIDPSSNSGSDWSRLVLTLFSNCLDALQRSLESIKINKNTNVS